MPEMRHISLPLMFKRTWPPVFCSISPFFIGLRLSLLIERIRGDMYALGRPTQAQFSVQWLPRNITSRDQLENVLKKLSKSLILGPYIPRMRIHCFCSKTKNVLVLSILFCLLFYFYSSISFLIGFSMTSVILSYLLILYKSSIWQFLLR